MPTRAAALSLTDLRAALQLTQAELAQLLGVSAATISRWEAGRLRVPGWHEAALIALRLAADKDLPEARAAATMIHSNGPICALHHLLCLTFGAVVARIEEG